MKEIKWLTQEEAKKIGITPKKNEKNRNKARYRLNSTLLLKYNSLKKQVQKVDSDSKPNDYKPEPFILSAWDAKKGKMLSIKEYCEKYNLPYDDISSFKFLPHHYKHPSYNIVFKDKQLENEVDVHKLVSILEKEIRKVYYFRKQKVKTDREGVLKWADLHTGAMIKELVNTRDFNTDILRQQLMESVEDFNSFAFAKRHVHIQGDLIESFSGLNHINSWQSMNPELIGAKVIKFCTNLIHDAVSRIKNLGVIKITGGNHDRLSKDNDEDVKAGAAEIIAYCLELMGYDVEFHPFVTTHKLQGINYINLHGDKKLSGKTSEEIRDDYGEPGMYNFITEAHLHTAMEKLTAKKRNSFDMIKTDKLKLRRIRLKPFFTGNYYSETLGYATNAGYCFIWANEHGLPKMIDNTI